jgi:hypothetical protein
MSEVRKRKLLRRVTDLAVATALILLIEGEKTLQTLKNKGERFFAGKKT